MVCVMLLIICPHYLIPYLNSPELSLLSGLSGSAKSWVWSYFKKVDAAGKHCLCLICNTEVNYSYKKSTGALGHHIKKIHLSVWQQHLRDKAEVSSSTSSTSTLSLDPFLKHCPKFEKCLLKWMIATYQPLCCIEDQHFRAMFQSLYSKAPIVSRVKLPTLISEEFHLAELKVKSILKGRFFLLLWMDGHPSITRAMSPALLILLIPVLGSYMQW
jgi:hypothetical protein